MKNRQDKSNNNETKNYKKKKRNDNDINANERNHSLTYGSDFLLLHGTICTMNIPNLQQE